MNQLLVFITILVAFVYFGGSNVPKVLKDNKQMLLGFVGGVVLYSSMGMRVEGMVPGPLQQVDPAAVAAYEAQQAECLAPKSLQLTAAGWVCRD